jgi:serine phosphatase RsbU (regulator of sigma subunit)
VRDGAVARAAHDYLYTYRGGKVSATLNILSIDATTKTFVISRNNDAPVIVHTAARGLYQLDEPSERVGVHRHTKPVITEIPILVGTIIVVFTDGLRHAGSLSGENCYEPFLSMQQLISAGITDACIVADTLLQEAYKLDKGRPRDDISVLVISVHDGEAKVRQLNGRITL